MTAATLDTLDLAKLIREGDTISWGGAAAEPSALLEVFNTQIERMPAAAVLLGFSLGEVVDAQRLAARLRLIALGGAGSNRRFHSFGGLDVLPAHYSHLPDLVRRGDLPIDVVLVQLAAGGAQHYVTLLGDYISDAMLRARVVVAEINDRAPCVFGEPPIERGDIDHLVHVSHPLVQWRAADGGDIARAIGAHVARLVPDGATLEVGLGALPDGVLTCLGNKKDLGLHSGIIGDRVADLVDAGVITNRRKPIDTGIGVTAGLLGTDRLYQWAHRNPQLHFRSSRYTHDIAVLGSIPRFYGINGALEVDLSGQVNAEVVNDRHVGIIGGQVDFLRGALRSPGGRGIVVLESTARKASVSRIVARLAGGVVTTARSDVDVVVTEFGAAHLRGRTLSERATALIAIAHPDFREGLQSAAQNIL